MATYTIYSDSSDGWIYSDSSTYSTARSGTGTGMATTDPTFTFGQRYSGSTYRCSEAFVAFDTSSVSGSVSTVTLSIYLNADNSTTDFTINARAYDWGTSVTTGDWIAGANLANNALRASKSTSGISTTAYTDLTSDSSFAANTSNPVRLVLCSSRMEGGNTPTGNEYVQVNATEQAGTFSDPKLVIVTQDADPTPIAAIMAPRIPAEADY